MADSPTIAGSVLSLDVAAFFRRYAALAGLIALVVFNLAVTPHFALRALDRRQWGSRASDGPASRSSEVLKLPAMGRVRRPCGRDPGGAVRRGPPAEGMGWELFSIAAVVVGGTFLSGGVGSVATTLAGVLLLGLIFNVLNFENGLGGISLSANWRSVVRGVFLMVVVMATSGAARSAIQAA
jgi:ribose transport system permease protein